MPTFNLIQNGDDSSYFFSRANHSSLKEDEGADADQLQRSEPHLLETQRDIEEAKQPNVH